MAGTVRVARTLVMGCGIGILLAAGGCQTERPRYIVQAPASCEPFAVSIYFAPDSAALSSPAAAVLSAAAKRAATCVVLGVKVLGLADAGGSSETNLRLSDRRATVVTQGLIRRGVSLSVIEVVGAGDVSARDNLGEVRPERRRVEVAFHLAPRSSIH